MKPDRLALGANLLVGVVYSLLGVRSPPPPAIALFGLAKILLGEQLARIASRLAHRTRLARFVRKDCATPTLGWLHVNAERDACLIRRPAPRDVAGTAVLPLTTISSAGDRTPRSTLRSAA